MTTPIVYFLHSKVLLLEKTLLAQPHTQAFLADELQHGFANKPSDSSLTDILSAHQHHFLSCGLRTLIACCLRTYTPWKRYPMLSPASRG